MMTDEEPVPVVAFTQRIPEGDHFTVEFTVDPEVSGVEPSGNLLIFQPGSYAVKIHLPEGFIVDPRIEWIDACPPKPSGFESSRDITWIQIGVNNAGPSVEESFPFEMSSTLFIDDLPVWLRWLPRLGGPGWLKRLLFWLWVHFIPQVPVVRSDPPPTIVFEAPSS